MVPLMSLPCLEQIIEKNTRVRLKIVGTRVDATEIVSLLILVQLQLLTQGSLPSERSRKIILVL